MVDPSNFPFISLPPSRALRRDMSVLPPGADMTMTGRFAPEAAVRYPTGPSNDWVKKTCLPVGQVAPVAPASYQGLVKR